ncbi:hypothetical protein Tco_1286104 [Tanacetum coccineum]
MVACLEKLEGNVDFHEIMDFLTASSVHYALTVTLTIYASYIEQFWNTAHSQTINDVKQIQATVDGKTIVISKSSVRSDLHFNDEDGITCLTNDAIFENLALMGNLDTNTKKYLMYPKFLQLFFNNQITLAEPFNDVYQTPAHTKKVFTNMKRKGKDFSGRVTPLFASMLAPPVVEGEGSGQTSEPQPVPSTTQPRIEEQIPVIESLSPQNTQSPRQALQEDTQFPQTSVPIPNVANESVFKEWDGRVVRATTTAASLDAAQASGNISKTQSTVMSNDPLSQEISLGGNTPRSDEERIKQDDLTDFVPPTPHDSPLSGGHTPGSDEGRKSDKTKPMFDDSDFTKLDVDNAMENVEGDAKTQGKNTAEQTTTAGDTVNTASIDVVLLDFQMITRPRTTLVIIHDVEEEPRRSTPAPTTQPSSKDKGKALMVEPEKPSKNPRKAQIQMDKELAIRLHEEEKAELERMQIERAAQE